MTKAQLLRFIAIRNASAFGSGLQFVLDAQEAGFSAKDLGQATSPEDGRYEWQTPHGLLIEDGGKLRLVGQDAA